MLQKDLYAIGQEPSLIGGRDLGKGTRLKVTTTCKCNIAKGQVGCL